MNKFIKSVALISLLFTTQVSAVTGILDSRDEGGNSVFSVELLESSCAKIGVVMYHGRGSTPTGSVVEELRNALYRSGYTTLSIDNPKPLGGNTSFSSYVDDVAGNKYVFPEAYARMRASINYMKTLGVEQVVIAGFSLGSRLAVAHVARGQRDELPIIGLIGIGMYGNSIDPDPLNVLLTLDEVSVPVLDIYGSLDTNAVNSSIPRSTAYNTGMGLSYTQESLPCDVSLSTRQCHRLEGLKGDDTKSLEITVNAWMQAAAPAAVAANCSKPPPPATAPPQTIPDAGGSALDLYLLFSLPVLLSVFRSRRDQNI